jgi:translation initiation factor IF-2
MRSAAPFNNGRSRFPVSAITQNKNPMTDTNPSDAPMAPAADLSAPAAGAETTAGKFGSTRGSGLARGKRPMGAAAPATSPVKTDYKPTAVEVITPQREYRNPFASPEPASAPAAEPAEIQAPELPAASEEPGPIAEAAAPVTPEPAAERPGIEILPPAETSRPAVSWESPSPSGDERHSRHEDRPAHDERPMFRADRREDRAGGARPEGGRPRFERREPRHDPYRGQPRDPRDEEPQFTREDPGTRAPEAQKPASGGFLGWLKSLFGGAKPAEAPARQGTGGEPFGDGHRHRRRHRGGRGRGEGFQGPRGERTGQGGERSAQGGAPREDRGGERFGGPRRRRHRGGSGRGRGDFRSEGHQGGGAI